MAGDIHTLTCTVQSELPANLKWVRILNGTKIEVVNTSTITVSAESVVDNSTTIKNITFNCLHTSHAGKYECISVLNNTDSKVLSTKELECVVKVKSKHCYGLLCVQN